VAIVRTHQTNAAHNSTATSWFVGMGFTPVVGRTIITCITSWHNCGLSSISQTGVNWSKLIEVNNPYAGSGERKPTVEIWIGEVVGPGVSSSAYLYKDVGAPLAACFAQYSGVWAAGGADLTASYVGNPGSNPATVVSGTAGTPSMAGELYVAAMAHNDGTDAWSSATDPGNSFSLVGKRYFNYTGGGQVHNDQQRLIVGDRIDASIVPGRSTYSDITGFGTIIDFVTGAIVSLMPTPPPNQAVIVDPLNGATGRPETQQLEWDPPSGGSPVSSYDVYFGTSYANVDAGVGGTFKGNQAGTTYDPGTLSFGLTHYWRIDTVGEGGTTKGAIWSFTVLTPAAPDPPTIVDPPNGSTGIPSTQQLEWAAPVGGDPHIDGYNVYFGQVEADVLAGVGGTFKGFQTGLTYDPGTLSAGSLYYWRVETSGPGGEGSSVVWSFSVFSEAAIVTNIVPLHNSTAKVGSSLRCSLRDPDSEVDRGKVNVYLGNGPVFYLGDELPQDLDFPTMHFEALSGHPNNPAELELDGDYLKISKLAGGSNQEAVLRMGGLEAPANPDAPMMIEFTLKLNASEVAYSGILSGVQVGLYANDSGVVVKFIDDGGRTVALYDAGLTGPQVVVPSTAFDWDVGAALNPDGSNTFKLLWHPQLDLVKLYVKDEFADSDRLLIETTVSAFGSVPSWEIRTPQPWVIFGHGVETAATSVSRWKGVFLHNEVSRAVANGIPAGGHVSIIRTNNQIEYDGTESAPLDASSPWLPLPASFGTWGGYQRVCPLGLQLTRRQGAESIGYHRIEPRVTGPIVLDFWLSGSVVRQEEGAASTGIEVYISDGTNDVRFALLQDSAGTQYVGILTDSANPELLSSYEGGQQSFGTERQYRLIYQPGDRVKLYNIIETDEGLTEDLVVEVLAIDLPAAALPGPGIGFLHNANAVDAEAEMFVRRIRYSYLGQVTDWRDLVSATPSWAPSVGGTVVPGTDSQESNQGADASIEEAAGVVSVSGLTGMSAESVGNYLRILNGDHPGIYRISGYITGYEVTIENPSASGADSGNPEIEWEEIVDPTFAIISDVGLLNQRFDRELIGVLQSDSGWHVEWRSRVASYTVSEGSTRWTEGVNPIRAFTGVVVQIFDGTFLWSINFAEAGPPLGKIVALQHKKFDSTADGFKENLDAIRAGDEDVAGTYAQVDWTKFHLYRFEKTVGGKVVLRIDEDVILEIDEPGFEPTTSSTNARIRIGHVDSEVLSVSHWDLLKYGISDGFELDVRRVLDEEEALSQFDQAFNVIIEAEDV